MGTSMSVVQVPELRCVTEEFKRGFAKKWDGTSFDAPDIQAWVEETLEQMGASADLADGVIYELGSMVALFDRRAEDVSCTVAIPLQMGARAPRGHRAVDIPEREVIELRYPRVRTYNEIIDDVYAQATTFTDKSKKRDLGDVIRILDKRRNGAKAGFVVQVETVERVGGG